MKVKVGITVFMSVIGGLLFGANATLADTSVRLSGGITPEDALVSDVVSGYPGWCDLQDRYESRPFSVSADGTYGFTDLNYLPRLSASFFLQINDVPEPSMNPLVNIDTYGGGSPIAAAPEGELVAGQEYYFVASTACYDVANRRNVSYYATLAGDGDITIDVDGDGEGEPEPAPSTPVPAMPFYALLLLGGLLGLFGLRRIRS